MSARRIPGFLPPRLAKRAQVKYNNGKSSGKRKMRMNIVHLVNFAGASGSEKYVRTLFTRQIAQGHRVTLVYNINGPLVEDAKAAGADVRQLTMHSPLDFIAGRKLAVICREKETDVIHTHFPRENCIAILAKRHIPSLTVLNTSHLVFTSGALWRILNRRFSPKDAAVLCVCTEQLKTLEANGVRKDRLHVVHNGIPPVDAPALRAEHRGKIRQEFGISEDAPVFITLARFTHSKGLDVLVRAMEKVHASAPDAKLIIAGQGEDFEKIGAQIKEAGLEDTVFTPGFRTDSQALLAAADLYVNASRSGEALSFAIIEAMAMGLVPVISDAGGNPDIVDQNSDWGVQFASEDEKALASILSDLAKNPRRMREMGEKARARAAQEFTEDKMYTETMRYYKE